MRPKDLGTSNWNLVFWRQPGQNALRVGELGRVDGILALDCAASNVGGKHNVVECENRVIGRRRLGIEDVNACTEEMA